MSKFTRIVIGIGGGFLILAIILFFFLRHLVTKSYPVTEGTIQLKGLQMPVTVDRDEYGIPHINAENEHDLMFAAGYVHAQDRLWQMELTRRAGEGRLSEILDTATIEFDKLFRLLDLSRRADTLYALLHPTARRMLEDYADGVNAFIRNEKGRYPIEFDMLNIEPKPWKPQHSVMISRLLAWELTFSWWVDLTYAEIATRVPPDKFREIFPAYPDSLPMIAAVVRTQHTAADLRPFRNLVRRYREYFDLGPFSAGSNAWVVSGAKSASGKPLLANDPHLRISVPGKWYEYHLTAPGWNVGGFSIPGMPPVVIGHNDSIAWGLTNAMLDDADFYIEREDAPDRYRYRNATLPMAIREEKILIGKRDSITITVRATHHGPIINDIRPSYERSYADSPNHRWPIALRWTGLELSDEFLAFYRMNRALNRVEFEEGARGISAPGQCIVYADVRGTIGFMTAGRIPVRMTRSGFFPLEGWTGNEEWKSYIPPHQLPAVWNPPGGIIICANQKITDDAYPFYLSTLWEPSSRAERIRDLLSSTEQFRADDFRQFQQDVVSYYCRDIAPSIFRAFEETPAETSGMHSVLEYLRNWDYRCTQGDVATSIFHAWFVRLLHNTFEDELGRDLFDDFVFFSAIPYRVTAQLLSADSSAWFDDVRTEAQETRGEIIRKSLREAVGVLTELLGEETKTWQWGKIHGAYFRHPFGKVTPLETVFNIGPFPIGGDATTINNADFKLSAPFDLFAGPSMRMVIDLAEPQTAFLVNQLGQSGQPLYRHFDDQVPLWLNGGYRRQSLDWNSIRKENLTRLTLEPAK